VESHFFLKTMACAILAQIYEISGLNNLEGVFGFPVYAKK